MARFARLHEIQQLDPVRDHVKIQHLSTGYEFPWDTVRALERMNWIHGHFKVANEDYLYVLSTFIYEPIRWIDNFGWRKLCVQEKLGAYYFWREIGKRMGIQNIPPTYDDFERYNRDYERGKFVRLLPPRKKPHFFTDLPNRTYPQGYKISEPGPPRLLESS